MAFFRNAFYFIATNLLVLVSVSILLSILSAVFGITFDPQSYMGLLIFSAIFGSAGAFISLMISKWSAKRSMGVQIIDPARATGDQKLVLDAVYRFARAAQLPVMPEVGIYNSPEVNAFATGPSKSNSLVAVSSGLLSTMSWDEVEGVLAHEVAHIANGDMVGMTLIQGVVNTFVIFLSHIVAGALTSGGNDNDNRRSGGVGHFMLLQLLMFVFGIFGSIVVAYYSRRREFRADRGSAQYGGKGKMIAALQALQQQVNRVMPPEQNEQFASFKISSGKYKGLMNLLSTHPPLEKRIAALQNNL